MLHELADSGIKIGFTTGFSRDIVDIIFNSLEWHPDISVAGDEV
ncbi:hypothetical protein [Corynebacterium poyangense]|nr:hypothetical protein [Corynebacterium poyangense]